MARTNKYTSINFNDIFERKSNNKTSSSSSNSTSSSSSSSSSSVNKTTRNHGGMLVLTRPTPKPLPQLQPQSQTKQPLQSSESINHHNQSRSEPESEPISLRPLGTTGSSSLTPPPPPPPPPPSSTSSSSPALITLPQSQESSVISLKPQPFVPPHLRPGFVGKEEKVIGQRNQGLRSRDIVQNDGFNGDNGRPKSGGGYERMRRGAESDLEVMNRPSSSGNRPSSSGGWYAGSSSSYRSPSHY